MPWPNANIDRHKAERVATKIFNAIHDNVATKQDVALLGTESRPEMAQLGLRLEARINHG